MKRYRKLYFNNWEAKKIVEIPVNDALRRPYKIVIDPKKGDLLINQIYEYSINKILRDCLILERLDGGCALFVGYDDDSDVLKPPRKNAKLKYFKIIELSNIQVIEKNPAVSAVSVEMPIYEYRIGTTNVHEDRLIFFHGIGLSTQKYIFAQSVLSTIHKDIEYAVSIRDRVMRVIKKTSCITALASNFTLTDRDKEYQLKEALRHMSTDQSIILDNDNVELKEFTTSFSDLSELINTYLKVLASALDIPVTRFLGLSNSGLTQSSDGDLENYYNVIQQLQESNIRRPLIKIIKLIYIKLFGVDEKVDDLSIEFPSLWNNSEEEETKIKTLKLNLILQAFDNGLLNGMEAINEVNSSNIFIKPLSSKDFDISPDEEEEEI
jgi:phage-related protein (TIGR01555 family)